MNRELYKEHRIGTGVTKKFGSYTWETTHTATYTLTSAYDTLKNIAPTADDEKILFTEFFDACKASKYKTVEIEDDHLKRMGLLAVEHLVSAKLIEKVSEIRTPQARLIQEVSKFESQAEGEAKDNVTIYEQLEQHWSTNDKSTFSETEKNEAIMLIFLAYFNVGSQSVYRFSASRDIPFVFAFDSV